MVIAGPAGAGKTTLADYLKSQLSYTAHIGVDHIKRFISEFREISAHRFVSMNVVNAMTREYLKNGINVIVEQGRMENKDIELLNNVANNLGVEFLFYKVEASREVLEKRSKERSEKLSKPLISKESMDEIMEKYKKIDYPAKKVFDSENKSTEETGEFILKDLNF